MFNTYAHGMKICHNTVSFRNKSNQSNSKIYKLFIVICDFKPVSRQLCHPIIVYIDAITIIRKEYRRGI